MRAVVQRADSAWVEVDGERVAGFDGPGLAVLVGVAGDDGPDDVAWLVRKVAELRILAGELSASEVGAPVLVVSQFTLHADVRKGRRPSWNGAASGEVAAPLVAAVAAGLRERGLPVGEGVFGAMMRVGLVNDGPFTIWLDTRAR